MRAIVGALFVFLLAAACPTSAGCEQTPWSPEFTSPSTGVSWSALVMGDGGSYPGRYYVDNDLCHPECLLSVWIYEETNGIDGLQRADEVVDDTCGGAFAGDTPIIL